MEKIKKEILITTRYGGILFVLFSTIILLVLQYLRLFSTSSALGIDGYYYILQTGLLLESKHLYFSSLTPIILYFLTGLSFLLGDSIVAVKVGAILLHFSLGFALFSIVLNLTEKFWLGVIALTICNISSLHLYLIVEYINYLGAISFLYWSILFLLLFIQKQRIIYILGAVGCLLLSVGSHRSIVPLTLLFIILTTCFLWIKKAFETNNKTNVTVGLTTLLLIFISPALLVLQPFFQLPISLKAEFSAIPNFPAKLSTFPEFFLLFCTSLTILYLIFFRNKGEANKTATVLLGSIALWSILITLNPFLTSDLGFDLIGGRLRVLAYIQVAILVPATIWLLCNSYKNITLYITILVLPFMAWSFFNPLPRGAQPEYLVRRTRLIEGLKISTQQVEENSLIVAAHGEQFVVTAITGIPSQQLFPKENKYNSVYWLLNLVPPTLLDSSMSIIAKDKIGFYTVLVKDDDKFRRRLQNVDIRRILRQSNKPLDAFLVENGYSW